MLIFYHFFIIIFILINQFLICLSHALYIIYAFFFIYLFKLYVIGNIRKTEIEIEREIEQDSHYYLTTKIKTELNFFLYLT